MEDSSATRTVECAFARRGLACTCVKCGPYATAVPREPDSRDHLCALVEAPEGAYISSWQSTAAWERELEAAREYLNRTEAA